jgi:hypothetical protein
MNDGNFSVLVRATKEVVSYLELTEEFTAHLASRDRLALVAGNYHLRRFADLLRCFVPVILIFVHSRRVNLRTFLR